MAVLCLNFGAMAQSSAALKIGDKLPEWFWQKQFSIYYEGKTTQQNLSAYKGKLLVLDFWATWCGTCIGKFPITDSLQRENKELKVLLINSNKADQPADVAKFFANNANGKTHPMPTLVGDTSIKALFPHKYVPHYVFVDYRGLVIGFGSYHFLNRAMVANLMAQHQRSIKKQDHEN